MAKKIKNSKSTRRKSLLEIFALYPESDSVINAVVFILIMFGSFMIISTDVGQTTSNSMIVINTLAKQAFYIVASYFCLWFINRIFSFRWFASLESALVLGAWVLMFLPLLFQESGGSRAWIRIGSISLQPSEFMKPFIIVVVACAVYLAIEHPRIQKKAMSIYRTPFITFIGIMVFLFLQKDIGTLAIITMIFYVCILIPKFPSIAKFQKFLKVFFVVGVIAGIGLFGVTDIGTDLIAQTPFSHIATRIKNFKNPYNDVYGEGYQPANALYGIANSNIVGQGIGGSARKFGYLTQADNDYIFAVLIEETGIFGLAILVVLYCILFFRLFYYAFKTNYVPYKVILCGNATYLFMHFFLSVGGVTSLIPMTGVPLLFISSGGSAMMAIFIMTGISQRCISEIRIREMMR